jgi:YARHG domain-containing protein
MRLLSLSILLAISTVSVGFTASEANAQSGACRQLWVERNSIYKAAGYCFKTSRGISYFGNAGCAYAREGAVPLSRGDRARIARIRAQERALGCR